MNLIIFVASVVGAFFIYKMAGGLIGHFLPDKWWAKPIYTLPGLGVGLIYIYFAGYYIMDKAADVPVSLLIAFVPWAVYIGTKIAGKSKLIEE
ncbi:MAG: hypothetical protein RR452_11250 [Clostridia bacterium]